MLAVKQPVVRRSDALRSMNLLTAAAGRLLSAGHVDFSIPELASEAGVGTATAYRHYATPSEARDAYSAHAVAQLAAALTEIDVGLGPAERFRQHCSHWVSQAQQWGPAVRHIRSYQGYVERLHHADQAIRELHSILGGVLEDLMQHNLMPATDPTFATLMWITIFDERVVYDLVQHCGWDTTVTATQLTRATAGALRINLGD